MVLLLIRVSAFFSLTAAMLAADADFVNDVMPILQTRCLSCHADKPNGGFSLTDRERLLKGGDSGPAIVVGNSEHSRLIRLITAPRDADEKMPPEGSRLSADQVSAIKRWIDAGAVWPDGIVLKSPQAASAEHWAFQPIRRLTAPEPGDPSGMGQPIDAFVREKLDQHKVEPSPEADRETLLRRMTFDLTGLPPTPDSLDGFLADDRPDAYERQLDRLFASPSYGERWARPWLDLCHFADTDGYLTDQLRPVAWRYRQWVIEALNGDLPFDQFTVEQLAGDLLPQPTQDQLIATGFLRNTLSNREGGADLEQFRVEQIVDRTQMIGVGWLGLSVGCARCHDHKFDPITQREYYQFYAFLDAADEVNRSLPLPGEEDRLARADAEFYADRAKIIAPYQTELDELQKAWERKILEAAEYPERDALWSRQWEVLGLIWGGNLGEGQLEGCVIVRTPWDQRTADEQARLQEYFLSRGSLIDEKRFSELKLSELLNKLTQRRTEVAWPTRAPTMRQARHPPEVHVHQRGEFRVLGEQVKPHPFNFLRSGVDETTTIAGGDNGRVSSQQPVLTRLDLAKWLLLPDHPLTARVVVNRVWQEFFGKGIVDPPNDFGLRGQTPSHPELLDWLASEYQRREWNTKAMHRVVMTSATYRQSARPRPELRDRDPHNRWLARQSPLRLNSDQVRDAILAVSGLLEYRVGGPSVFPPQPDEVMNEGFNQHGWKASEGADRYRRAVYTWIARLSPFAQNVTFDAPPTNAICTRRDRTNSPLQALTLLNDPVFYEAARSLSKQIMTETDGNPEIAIPYLFKACLGRSPREAEARLLTNFYKQQVDEFQRTPDAVDQSAPATSDPVRRMEHAVWTNVASVVMNLHEFITRD